MINRRLSVGKRTPQSIEIRAEEIPENESDAICRTILNAMGRVFEDPEVKEDYKRWKKERDKRRELQ